MLYHVIKLATYCDFDLLIPSSYLINVGLMYVLIVLCVLALSVIMPVWQIEFLLPLRAGLKSEWLFSVPGAFV